MIADRDEVLPPLVELASELDRKTLASLSWVGVNLFSGLLENA